MAVVIQKIALRVRSIINLGLVARRLTGFLPPPITDEYPSLAPASVSGLFLYCPLLAALKLRRSFAAVTTSTRHPLGLNYPPDRRWL
jgi:hypothetical protein